MARGDLLLSRFFLPHTPAPIRTRVAICCSFFIQGLAFATWCARIPDVRARLGLHEAQLGTLLLMLPIGQLLSMAPNGFLVGRFGSRRMLVLAGFAYPAALVALGFAPDVPTLAIALFLAGVAANLSNTAANTQGVMLERHYRRSIMSLFHGMWSIAGLVAVALAMALARLGVPMGAHVALLCGASWLLLCFSGGALMRRDRQTPAAPAEGRPAWGGWRLTPFIFWVGVAALGCLACEGAIYDWSGVYLKDVVGASAARQSVGYFGYLCTMVGGRFVADRVIDRFGVAKVLYGCGACISGGLALAVAFGRCAPSTALWATVAGFALVGCGTSAVVPICCGLAGKSRDLAPGIAIAEISTIGFFGFLAVPPLIGYVAHASGLRVAFAIMSAIGLLVILSTWALRRDLAPRTP